VTASKSSSITCEKAKTDKNKNNNKVVFFI